MKQVIMLTTLFCLLVTNGYARTYELPVVNPIVGVDRVIEFGIWRLYNKGTRMVITDPDMEHVLIVKPTFKSTVVSTPEKTYNLVVNGTSGILKPTNTFYNMAQTALFSRTAGRMQNARYRFGNKIFQVIDDTMTIFYAEDEDESGVAIPRIVINKFSNRVEHIGTRHVSVIDPTITARLHPNGVAVPIESVHSGLWRDETIEGRGGNINIDLDENGNAVMMVSWFDYHEDGSQMWLMGTSEPLEHGATRAEVPVLITFKDSSGEVIQSSWGTFLFKFTGCDTGYVMIEADTGEPSETILLMRMSKRGDLACQFYRQEYYQ
ncbi:MAG TPA: hypothetical protein ENJ32_07270 [Crenotrichaceae bacterium]|nr:hypothetical protein [Crenotrichaceae bacterium]